MLHYSLYRDVLLAGEREVAGAYRMKVATDNTMYRQRMGRLKKRWVWSFDTNVFTCTLSY